MINSSHILRPHQNDHRVRRRSPICPLLEMVAALSGGVGYDVGGDSWGRNTYAAISRKRNPFRARGVGLGA